MAQSLRLRVRELPGKPRTVDASLAQERVTADGELNADFRLQPARGYLKLPRPAGRRPRKPAEIFFSSAVKIQQMLMAHSAPHESQGEASAQPLERHLLLFLSDISGLVIITGYLEG